MVMLTIAEVMTGFVVLGGLSFSGRLVSTASEATFSEMPGWRIYFLIDQAGNWIFWCGIALFLVGYVTTNLFFAANILLWGTAAGYMLAVIASLPVTVAFVWRTAHLKRAPFFLGSIAGLVASSLSKALASPADTEDAGDKESDDECHHSGAYGSHAFYNCATGKWDDGYDSGGIYLKDDD